MTVIANIPHDGSIVDRLRFAGEPVYSNLDHVLDADVVEVLKSGTAHEQHAAWDHCGYVWREAGEWREEVWVHHSIVGVYATDGPLQSLIDHVNELWGTA